MGYNFTTFFTHAFSEAVLHAEINISCKSPVYQSTNRSIDNQFAPLPDGKAGFSAGVNEFQSCIYDEIISYNTSNHLNSFQLKSKNNSQRVYVNQILKH